MWVFNPFTNKLDWTVASSTSTPSPDALRVVSTGQTRTIANKYSVIVLDYFAVEGTGVLAIQGDGALGIL